MPRQLCASCKMVSIWRRNHYILQLNRQDWDSSFHFLMHRRKFHLCWRMEGNPNMFALCSIEYWKVGSWFTPPGRLPRPQIKWTECLAITIIMPFSMEKQLFLRVRLVIHQVSYRIGLIDMTFYHPETFKRPYMLRARSVSILVRQLFSLCRASSSRLLSSFSPKSLWDHHSKRHHRSWRISFYLRVHTSHPSFVSY